MRGVALALALGMMIGGAQAQDAALPVAVGGGQGSACPQLAKADAEIDVHVGPGDAYEVYDHIAAGQTVFLCEKTTGWYGIVYGKADCGVSKPITLRQGYLGACNTGWVQMRSLTAAAE
jgi:hypothetical protein